MWPFGHKISKQELHGTKKIVLCGRKFIIRKLNPFLDFTSDNIPQIFTSFISQRKSIPKEYSTMEIGKIQKDMKIVVEAGIVSPELVPVGHGDNKGKESGITVDDIFRDSDLAAKLYWEILIHSLNKFKGIKGLFFSIRLKYLLWTLLQKGMGDVHQKLSSQMENSV